MNNNDFESFLLLLIELLAASDLLDELLNNDFIVVVCLARGDFNMVIRREHDAFN